MTLNTCALATTAFAVGFIHTLTGPDHYLPIVALAKTRGWSRSRATVAATLYGAVHVGSAAIIGLAGLAAGSHFLRFDSTRADVSASLLIGFGAAYALWGVRKARTVDVSGDSTAGGAWFSPVVLTLFLVGPCEPLLPLLALSAAQRSPFAVALVLAAFGSATLLTMTAGVAVLMKGMARARVPGARRYAHAWAGAVLLVSGLGMKFFGW